MTGSGIVESPMGPLKILARDGCITNLSFEIDSREMKETPVIVEARAQLEAYFKGNLKSFDLPLQPEGTPFQKEVWKHLMEINFGKTSTYLLLAKKLGDAKKIRAVGLANGKNPIPIIIPCHRVIGSDGQLVGYSGGIEKKEWLLRHEGADLFSQKELF